MTPQGSSPSVGVGGTPPGWSSAAIGTANGAVIGAGSRTGRGRRRTDDAVGACKGSGGTDGGGVDVAAAAAAAGPMYRSDGVQLGGLPVALCGRSDRSGETCLPATGRHAAPSSTFCPEIRAPEISPEIPEIRAPGAPEISPEIPEIRAPASTSPAVAMGTFCECGRKRRLRREGEAMSAQFPTGRGLGTNPVRRRRCAASRYNVPPFTERFTVPPMLPHEPVEGTGVPYSSSSKGKYR